MEFKKNQSIFLQIADFICEKIVSNNWKVGEKIPSVREMAATIEVNPNTIMRSYSYLQDKEIIKNKRGIGYFVNILAPTKINEMQKKTFVEDLLPDLFNKMDLLGITISDLEKYYKSFKIQQS